jgi:alkylated DNA repair dioxygenase AlkB
MQQLNLLDSNTIATQPVQFFPQFLSPALADRLLIESLTLAWQHNEIRMFGKPLALPRLEYMCGDSTDMHYVYSGSVELRAEPWPPLLEKVRDDIEALTGFGFQVCIGNRYRDGQDSIGYHADDEPSMGLMPAIASISLGATRTFRIKQKLAGAKSVAYELRHGDLLVMQPGCQENFVHAVPKTAKACGERVNWTFRPYH